MAIFAQVQAFQEGCESVVFNWTCSAGQRHGCEAGSAFLMILFFLINIKSQHKSVFRNKAIQTAIGHGILDLRMVNIGPNEWKSLRVVARQAPLPLEECSVVWHVSPPPPPYPDPPMILWSDLFPPPPPILTLQWSCGLSPRDGDR